MDHSVECLPNLPAVIVDGVSRAVRELDLCYTCLLVSALDRPIREDALLLSTLREYALQGAIRESDLLGPIREVLLELTVVEPEYLKAIRECGLGRALLTEVVDDSLPREGLLDITVREMDKRVTVWPDLAADTVGKDDLAAVVAIESLDLSVFSNHFLSQFIARLMLRVWLQELVGRFLLLETLKQIGITLLLLRNPCNDGRAAASLHDPALPNRAQE